ncbi:MAG: Fe-S-cluster containining protein [Desulforhopalus sp.]|jgi:Fe-S-cluster containining protein
MQTMTKKCTQCGKCCEEGGPALHTQDVDLVKSGQIPVSSLITLRKGELAHNPKTGQVQSITVELVKLTGTGRKWNCVYYDGTAGCSIYHSRPYACRALKCWDTEEILALVEKDTLDRAVILGEDHIMIPIIAEHERICRCDDLEYIQKNYGKLSSAEKKDVEKRVRHDLRFRSRIIKDFDLKLSEELFYFGRPLFQLLQPLGVKISEVQNEIHLKW